MRGDPITKALFWALMLGTGAGIILRALLP